MAKRGGKTNDEARAESRSKLLKAGASMFVEHARSEPFKALRIRDVCKTAGYSSGAFYVHWDSAEDYAEALGGHLLDEDVGAWDADFERISTIARETDTSDPLRAVDAVAAADLESILTNEIQDPMILFNLTAGMVRYQDDVREGYRAIDKSTSGLYAVLMARLGREPRHPYTYEQIGTILQATIEGMYVRHRIDPGAVETAPGDGSEMSSVYSAAVASLLTALTRSTDDARDVPTYLRDQLSVSGANPDLQSPVIAADANSNEPAPVPLNRHQ
jgi:AcrR family transcriptional regulator